MYAHVRFEHPAYKSRLTWTQHCLLYRQQAWMSRKLLHIPWGGIRDELHVYERLARRLILEGICLHFIELQRQSKTEYNVHLQFTLKYYVSLEKKRTFTMG